MKKITIVLACLIAGSGVLAQAKRHDSTAIALLDRMSDIIGGLESCSYRLHTAVDVTDTLNMLVKEFSDYHVYMSGPDKMLINAHGRRGHHQMMYNGSQLSYYSFDEHNYGLLSAPPTTLQMIDTMNNRFGIEFPAADFFYPAFTDDLLEDADTVRFLGKSEIDGKEYFDILAIGKKMNYQIWLSNDEFLLPARFLITYKSQPGSPQYFAIFSDWQINPVLPSAMFDFTPPPGARQVYMMAKGER